MQASQTNFRLGAPMWGDSARQLSAKLLDQIEQPGLIKALFHYLDTDNGVVKTAPGFAPVHFKGSKDGFSLIGFGNTGIAIVEDVTPLLAKLLGTHTKVPVHVDRRVMSIDIQPRPYALRYSIPRLVAQKKPKHKAWLANPETGIPYLEGLIMRGITTQAAFLGIDIPQQLELKFLGSTGEFAAKLGHGSLALLGMRDVSFELNASLSGLWTFGFIASKGYGLMNADLQKAGIV